MKNILIALFVALISVFVAGCGEKSKTEENQVSYYEDLVVSVAHNRNKNFRPLYTKDPRSGRCFATMVNFVHRDWVTTFSEVTCDKKIEELVVEDTK